GFVVKALDGGRAHRRGNRENFGAGRRHRAGSGGDGLGHGRRGIGIDDEDFCHGCIVSAPTQRAMRHPVVPDKRATSERDPGPITTGLRFAKAGAPASSNNMTLWLWVPAFRRDDSGGISERLNPPTLRKRREFPPARRDHSAPSSSA